MRSLAKSNAFFEIAARKLPLGVSSNYRYWGPLKTRYIERGKGAHLWDVDGNRYIDYRMGYGPAILGHSDQRVDNAVWEAMQRGQTFAMSIPEELEVAEKMIAMCPSVEMVRFCNSGTEATMHALRVARAWTGREKFIMFEGQYHGLHDGVMFAANIGGDNGWSSNRRSPVIFAFSSGIPKIMNQLVTLLPFNDAETLERVVLQSANDLAAILVEPMLGNCGGIMPDPDWLPLIRRLCDEHGIVMILDEVKTGFRIAKGGAQEVFGIRADLATYAKAMGNGYPVGAFGGRRDIMSIVGEGVSHGGTFAGNRVSMAAANATLDILQNTDALARVAQTGKKIQEGLSKVISQFEVPHVISGQPAMFIVWFDESPPREYRDWKSSDHSLYDSVADELIERGVMPEPDSREPWFISAAHSNEDVAETLEAFEQSLKKVLEARQHPAEHMKTPELG